MLSKEEEVSPPLLRLGKEFELDLGAVELRKGNQAVRLGRIPMELLLLLVERRGKLVTREQIIERVWGKDVFLDTDNSINAPFARSGKSWETIQNSPVTCRRPSDVGTASSPIYERLRSGEARLPRHTWARRRRNSSGLRSRTGKMPH